MDFRTMLKKKKYAKNVIAEDDPDWGNLKKVERPEAEPEPDDKPVRSLLILRTFSSARTELRALLVFLHFVMRTYEYIMSYFWFTKTINVFWRLDIILTQTDAFFPNTQRSKRNSVADVIQELKPVPTLRRVSNYQIL